jgi:small-conductance mechanosensitive channel/CRP-like cAMP-binding protein
VNRPHLRNQLSLPLLFSLLFGLTLYIIYSVAPPRPLPGAPEQQHITFLVFDWAWTLVSIGFWISLAFIAVRALNELIFFIFRKRKGYDAPSLMRDIFSLAAYVTALALILKYNFVNFSFGALLSGSALLGIILGLALQDTLGNLFAGISFQADKPFQVGDVIAVAQTVGVVESVTWRAVKIKTFQNHIILIGNSIIAKESIEVCPRGNANARIVFFNALYTDSPVKVIHVVREAVRDCDNVLRYMTPVVRIRNLAADGVDYEVKYWLSDYARYNDTDALVRQRIWYAFRRNGLSFAYPTRTVLLQRPAKTDGVGHETLTERLSAIDIFSPLTNEELRALASNANGHIYAPGELIIRAGDQGASMFVIHRGSVDVRIDHNGTPRTINTLREGDFFGEMALFTGEPRTASVFAAEETEVLEIGKGAMKDLFETNPDLVESLSHAINERRAALAARASTPVSAEDTPAGLLSRIKRFFRID